MSPEEGDAGVRSGRLSSEMYLETNTKQNIKNAREMLISTGFF
jgi:hypothetical protein